MYARYSMKNNLISFIFRLSNCTLNDCNDITMFFLTGGPKKIFFYLPYA